MAYVSSKQQQTLPNDPLLNYQWYLNSADFQKKLSTEKVDVELADIQAPQGWSTRKNASEIIIAIIDHGVDTSHPDLKSNIWHNPGEKLDGNDTDGNGYKDDIHGWNFVSKSPIVDISDSHGTHVAGIAAASGNNQKGITGVAWNAQIMTLDVMGSVEGEKNTEEIEAEAIRYAVDNGAKIINISLGENLKEHPDFYLKREKILKPAFQYAYDHDVFISIAAGNEGDTKADKDYWPGVGNLDKYALHTASFSELFSNIATVVALDYLGKKTNYASYGQRTTIAAPGGTKWGSTSYEFANGESLSINQGILSTVPVGTGEPDFGGNYNFFHGSSMAAPVIAGMAALIRSENTSISASDTVAILRASADKNPQLDAYVNGGLSANLHKALLIAKDWQGPETLTAIEQDQHAPVINLSHLTSAHRLTGTLQVTREAHLDPVTGFYKTIDSLGTVENSEGEFFAPGDEGYAKAALQPDNIVASLSEVSLNHNAKITRSFNVNINTFLAPFAQVNENTWFGFKDANWDNFAHFKLIGPNTFGLEDLAHGGDKDFNDHILSFQPETIL